MLVYHPIKKSTNPCPKHHLLPEDPTKALLNQSFPGWETKGSGNEMGFEVRRPGFESQLAHLTILWP